MAKLYCITNEATDMFFVVASDEADAESKYNTFLAEDPAAPQGDGAVAVYTRLVASDVANEGAPWATFVE